MQSCTIFLSCVGRNRPSIPDPYLEVPSAMLPRSIMTTSFQPFWTRWYATEFPIRPEPAIRTWVWAGSFASTGIRMMESFDFCVGLPQGETPCEEAADDAAFCDAKKALADDARPPRPRVSCTGRENIVLAIKHEKVPSSFVKYSMLAQRNCVLGMCQCSVVFLFVFSSNMNS